MLSIACAECSVLFSKFAFFWFAFVLLLFLNCAHFWAAHIKSIICIRRAEVSHVWLADISQICRQIRKLAVRVWTTPAVFLVGDERSTFFFGFILLIFAVAGQSKCLREENGHQQLHHHHPETVSTLVSVPVSILFTLLYSICFLLFCTTFCECFLACVRLPFYWWRNWLILFCKIWLFVFCNT